MYTFCSDPNANCLAAGLSEELRLAMWVGIGTESEPISAAAVGPAIEADLQARGIPYTGAELGRLVASTRIINCGGCQFDTVQYP